MRFRVKNRKIYVILENCVYDMRAMVSDKPRLFCEELLNVQT